MRYTSHALVLLLVLTACQQKVNPFKSSVKLNALAEKYVRLGLEIGKYDSDFVDAYYGPTELKPDILKQTVFPKESLLKDCASLQSELNYFSVHSNIKEEKHRADWLCAQLRAFAERIRIFSGEYKSFDEECIELYGVRPPHYDAAHYQTILDQLKMLLPGTGDINERFQQLANRFIIPDDKVDTVFKTAISIAAARTRQYLTLPVGEKFSLEYVHHEPWSGYNWYKGDFTSLIQINRDNKILIERAIDVASHESYPGHHVYNMLLEDELFRNKGYVEMSIYPLFSGQSLIAEGSANYGIDMIFPGNQKKKFAAEVLLPLAGLDTTGIGIYFRALELKEELSFVRNEVAKGILDRTMTEEEGVAWLMKYGLYSREAALKSLQFIRKYRGYVINYNFGKHLVQQFVEDYVEKYRRMDLEMHADLQKWERYMHLLSHQILLSELTAGKTK